MSQKFNVAMVGLGFGAEFLPIYKAHPLANVQALCQRNVEKLKKCGDQFGIDKRYTTYDEVLADKDIDFVHINSPINDHAWMS
jgi:predicted dehydrogenase